MVNENKIKKIEELEKRILKRSIENHTTEEGGFTVRFDDERGRNVMYVRDMSIKYTGMEKEYYDKNSPLFNPINKEIKWPYTGFVKGNILGWVPISIPVLVNFLENPLQNN